MVRAVTPIPFVKARFFDRCGKPLAGGKVYTYFANTTTPKVTYKDPYGLTPNTNPIILDAAGEADIYLDGTYRIRVTDAKDVLVNDVEKIGSWFSGSLQDGLDNISLAMDDAIKPKLAAFDGLIADTKNTADVQLADLQAAINTAYQYGAGKNGWSTDLVVENGLTQKQINKLQKAINDAQQALNIDYDKTVTVGANGADFTTINAALTELSKYKKVYIADNSFSNTRAKILLKSGFVAAEQININGQDFGWIDIVSEDAEVTISRQALTQKVGRWYSFLRAKNGVMPSIKTLFSMDKTGTASERVGLYMIQGVGFIEENCGFKNSGERNCDITQCSILSCGRGIFTGAEVLNFRPATGSVVFMQYADVSNAPTGLSASTAARVGAENLVAKNCSTAVSAQGGVSIDLTLADLSNASYIGLSATSSNDINCDSITLNNCGYGIYAVGGSNINASNAKINNSTTVGIYAAEASRVNAKTATMTGNKVGVICESGATVNVSYATVNTSVNQSLVAQLGGTIIANSANYRKDTAADSTSDAQVLTGGTIVAISGTGGSSQTTDISTKDGNIVKGVKTKSKGQNPIATGSTSVTINHGLGAVPYIILATPMTILDTPSKWWISNVTATQFTINVDQAVTRYTTFSWLAEL